MVQTKKLTIRNRVLITHRIIKKIFHYIPLMPFHLLSHRPTQPVSTYDHQSMFGHSRRTNLIVKKTTKKSVVLEYIAYTKIVIHEKGFVS